MKSLDAKSIMMRTHKDPKREKIRASVRELVVLDLLREGVFSRKNWRQGEGIRGGAWRGQEGVEQG